jgi:hypothetical protein
MTGQREVAEIDLRGDDLAPVLIDTELVRPVLDATLCQRERLAQLTTVEVEAIERDQHDLRIWRIHKRLLEQDFGALGFMPTGACSAYRRRRIAITCHRFGRGVRDSQQEASNTPRVFCTKPRYCQRRHAPAWRILRICDIAQQKRDLSETRQAGSAYGTCTRFTEALAARSARDYPVEPMAPGWGKLLRVSGTNQEHSTHSEDRHMSTKNTAFQEFRAYWRLSDEMIAKGSKEDIAEVARILAMQAAHYARTYGELPIPDLHHLLSDPHPNEDGIGLLRDGTMALVGVMATVVGLEDGEANSPLK